MSERHRVRPRSKATLVVILLAGLLACIPVNKRRSLPGGYYLEGWQAGTIWTLGGPQYGADAGGVLSGSIKRIGWNDGYIVAWRSPMIASDAAGWMVVDIQTNVIRGPMSDAALTEFQAAHPRVGGIQVKAPADYFAD
jgi:hypothetical protein